MLLIPIEEDEKTIASGFRKSPMFVFIDKVKGIVIQENHFKKEKSSLFFENFKNYDVDSMYVKNIGYKTFLKLHDLGISIYLIPDDIQLYTHIDMNELIHLTQDNAEMYCTLGHHEKETK